MSSGICVSKNIHVTIGKEFKQTGDKICAECCIRSRGKEFIVYNATVVFN